MKASKNIRVIILTLIFLLSVLMLTSALNPGEASIRAIVSNTQPKQGETVMVTLFFENNFTEPLILTNAGLHFDWMPKDGFYGFNLKENPITVQAGGSYVFQNQIRVKVPNETSLGAHSYYAGVDGVYGSSQAPFSVDSVEAELEVISSGIQTPAPTNPGSGNQGNGQGSDLLLYGAIAAVIIVVILLLVIVIMRKKKTTHVKSTEQPIEETDQAKPEQKPSGQDFSI